MMWWTSVIASIKQMYLCCLYAGVTVHLLLCILGQIIQSTAGASQLSGIASPADYLIPSTNTTSFPGQQPLT